GGLGAGGERGRGGGGGGAPGGGGESSPAISEHADVEIVAHAVGLRAAGDQRVEGLVEDVGDEIRLRAAGLGDLVHRSGLIDDEQKAGRIVPADLGLI